jgi:hypothetical protein
VGLLLVGIAIGLLIAGGMAIFRAVTSGGNESAGHHDPLRVTVERTGHEPWSVAFRDDAPLVPSLDRLAARSRAEVYAVLREHHGVDFGATQLRLSLSAHGEDAVVVRDISVVVVRRDPPFTGRLIGTGGSAAQRPAGVLPYDLDTEDPATTARPLLASTITVRRDQPVDVTVVGTTNSAYCQWRIHIDTEVGDEPRRMTIGDRDLPFETTGCDLAEFADGLELIA